MKKQLLWLLMAAPMSVWAQKAPFVISGQFKNPTNEVEKMSLFYELNGKRVSDSTRIVDGKYSFKGTINEPAYAIITTVRTGSQGRNGRQGFVLFIEPGNINITHDEAFSNVVISGSTVNAEFTKLQKMQEPINRQFDTLMKEYQKAAQGEDKEGMSKADVKLRKADSLMKETYLVYFNENPSSPIALYALQNYLPNKIDADKIEPLYDKLKVKDKQSDAGKDIKSRIDAARTIGIGKIAPDFTQNDTLGKPVRLSSFKGKYVLLDFWASWCGPCREENPNVLKAYKAYKNKGFTVLGISLDNPGGKSKWLKAIHDDGLNWTQVSDLHGWANAVARSYGIRSIPQNFLIDPQGKIIAQNLRGEDLEKKLAELFKKI